MVLTLPDICENHEKLRIFTALGIRFWDPALNIQISDHLLIKTWMDKTYFPVRYGFRTASGNYAFQGIPGIKDVEYPMGNNIGDKQKKYIVEVEDELDRFIPIVFNVDLPLPYKGLYYSNNGNALPGFYLFSSPSRTSIPGLAAVRGQLFCKSTKIPASYAFVEVEIEGKKWFGISNKRGIVAVIFQYPLFKNTSAALPENRKVISPFSQQKWSIEITIRYSPKLLEIPDGSDIPLLKTIAHQKEGLIWKTKNSSVPKLSSEIIFDQEFILKTGNESVLLID